MSAPDTAALDAGAALLAGAEAAALLAAGAALLAAGAAADVSLVVLEELHPASAIADTAMSAAASLKLVFNVSPC
jgi:hypothetical protein